MDAYEKGNAATPNYYTKRLEFIKRTYPDMEKSKAHEYAAITRGMNYEDIQYFIQSNNYDGTGAATLTGYQDKHNTCDPETGNYMERILPLKEYRYLLSGEEDGLCFIQVGFYNLFGKNKLKNLCARIANKLIRSIGTWGIRFPFFHHGIHPQQTGKVVAHTPFPNRQVSIVSFQKAGLYRSDLPFRLLSGAAPIFFHVLQNPFHLFPAKHPYRATAT